MLFHHFSGLRHLSAFSRYGAVCIQDSVYFGRDIHDRVRTDIWVDLRSTHVRLIAYIVLT